MAPPFAYPGNFLTLCTASPGLTQLAALASFGTLCSCCVQHHLDFQSTDECIWTRPCHCAPTCLCDTMRYARLSNHRMMGHMKCCNDTQSPMSFASKVRIAPSHLTASSQLTWTPLFPMRSISRHWQPPTLHHHLHLPLHHHPNPAPCHALFAPADMSTGHNTFRTMFHKSFMSSLEGESVVTRTTLYQFIHTLPIIIS